VVEFSASDAAISDSLRRGGSAAGSTAMGCALRSTMTSAPELDAIQHSVDVAGQICFADV
jgi:hypothetical protein